jgi:hypothetical protein
VAWRGDHAGQRRRPTSGTPQAHQWFSGNNGTCVEVAALSDGHIAVRSSTRPQEGTILFTRAEMNAWVSSVKAGEFDDMVS